MKATRQTALQPNSQCNRQSRLVGKTLIAARLRFAPDARAGAPCCFTCAQLPASSQRGGRVLMCFPSSSSVSPFIVSNGFRRKIVERGNESALAEDLRRLSDEDWWRAVVFLQMLNCDSHNAGTPKMLCGEGPAEAVLHPVVQSPFGIQGVNCNQRRVLPNAKMRQLVAAATGCAEWLASKRSTAHRAATRAQLSLCRVTMHSCSHSSSGPSVPALQPIMRPKGACRQARARFRYPAGGAYASQ